MASICYNGCLGFPGLGIPPLKKYRICCSAFICYQSPSPLKQLKVRSPNLLAPPVDRGFLLLTCGAFPPAVYPTVVKADLCMKFVILVVLYFVWQPLWNKMKILIEEVKNEVNKEVNKLNKRDGLDEKGKNGNLDKLKVVPKYGTALLQLAAQGKIDPVIGRDKEIHRVTKILCKRKVNNVCLVGDPGVGKTVIVEGLALLIHNNAVPTQLLGKKIYALEMGRLEAGTEWRGQFEERLTKIVDEVTTSNGEIILFIDELHTLIGAGGCDRAANILKPALAQGNLRCIGATTMKEYKKHIEKDAALKRRFLTVQVCEPSVDEAIAILKGVQNKYETHHNVKYDEDAIIACVVLSNKYINEQSLPHKAIELMDEAGSEVEVMHTGLAAKARIVTKDHIRDLVSSITGIPAEELCCEELRCERGDDESAKRMLSLEKILGKHVIEQDEAIGAISRAIRRARVGLRDHQRPIASFLFTGPTGVGKTETAKVLAGEYFASSSDQKNHCSNMIRLDMSEYMESHSVSKLIGSPPGYVDHDKGGQLTEAIRRTPHALVLLDEIEKAHPKIFDIFLQILDDGRLTDSKGNTVDFKNTIIIMTSNVITDSVSDEEDVSEKLKKTFRPEFLNRIDEIVVFNKLNMTSLKKIMDEMLRKVVERIKTNNKFDVEVSPKFKKKLLEESSRNISYGARPLKRAISRLLEDNLAEGILNGSIKTGENADAAATVLVDVNSTGKVFVKNKTRRVSYSRKTSKSVVTKIAETEPENNTCKVV